MLTGSGRSGGGRARRPADRRRGRRALQPVALALKSIGRQIDPVRTPARKQIRPIHHNTIRMSLREESNERLHLQTTSTQRHSDQRAFARIPIQAIPHRRRKNTIRTQLKKTRNTKFRQHTDPIRETDRPTRVTNPIISGSKLRRISHPTRHIRNNRDRGRTELKLCRHLAQLCKRRLHQRRMKSMTDTQSLELATRL